MYYAARIAKERHPDAKIVFIGPCVAKRKEARRDECVDYILTFEEMASIFEGLDIQLEQTQPFSVLYTSVREATSRNASLYVKKWTLCQPTSFSLKCVLKIICDSRSI
jgi:iron only hydrogenase large subunit-like protein